MAPRSKRLGPSTMFRAKHAGTNTARSVTSEPQAGSVSHSSRADCDSRRGSGRVFQEAISGSARSEERFSRTVRVFR